MSVIKQLAPLFTVLIMAGNVQAGDPENIFTFHPRSWYGDKFGPGGSISPDGKYFLYTSEQATMLRDLTAGSERPIYEFLSAKKLGGLQWGDSGSLLNYTGPGDDGPAAFVVDVASQKKSTSDEPLFLSYGSYAPEKGLRLAWYRKPQVGHGFWLDDSVAKTSRKIEFADLPSAISLSPTGNEIAYLLQNETGWHDLLIYSIEKETSTVLRPNIGTTYHDQQIVYSPDGQTIFISMVAVDPGTPESRQQPETDRKLRIFRIDHLTGSAQLFHEGEGDSLLVGRVQDSLVWIQSITEMTVAVLDPQTGSITPAFTDKVTSLPFWHPTEKRLAFTYGNWHLADWALNWDIGGIEVTGDGTRSGDLQVLVAGNHEDYGLNWSPNGNLMAFHSHRSRTPATRYGADDGVDAIFIRSANLEQLDEIQLTSKIGTEVGHPDWAPDSLRLVFTAMDQRGMYNPWIVTIDPATGWMDAIQKLNITGVEGSVVSAAWSQKRPEMAIEQRISGGKTKLWLVAENGSTAKPLVEYSVATELGWTDFSADGNAIYYSAIAEGHHQIFRISRDGGEPEQLTHSDFELIQPQVSPDNRHVALTRYRNSKLLMKASME